MQSETIHLDSRATPWTPWTLTFGWSAAMAGNSTSGLFKHQTSMASSFSSHGFNSSKMSRSTLQSASMPCHAFVASFLGWWIRQVFFHSPSGRKSTNQLGDHLSANFWDHYSIVAPQKTSCLVEILDTPKLTNTHGSYSP